MTSTAARESQCDDKAMAWNVTSCWRHPWCTRAVLLLTVATLLSVSLPHAPLSRFFMSEDAERHRLLSENEQRLLRSDAWLEQYRAEKDPRVATDSASAVDVGITVLTMRRGRRMTGGGAGSLYRARYLTQAVAEMLRLLNDTSLHLRYSLHLCNVDDSPDLFSEAAELEDVVPVFRRYGEGSPPPPHSVWEKLKLDYVYCLQQTLRQGVRYALLLEDDAVAHHHVLHVVEDVLRRVLETPAGSSVAYVKLYHPQRLLGYFSLEVERLPELLALALTLGAALTLLQRDVKDAAVTWAGWAVVVAVLALAVGRTNLLELRRLSYQLYQVTPTPSCCIPAVLYTRRGAQDLAAFLRNVTCTARRSTDIRMDEFRERGGWRGLLVQPNLFSHIGLLSSLRTKEVSPLYVQ